MKNHFVDPTNARHFLTHAQTRFGLGTRTSAVDGNWKFPGWERLHAKTVAWSHNVEGHVKACVERCCELANKKCNFTKYHLLGWTTLIPRRRNWKRLGNCPQYARKLSFKMCAHGTGRPDIPWSVNKLAQAITKWTRACDRRPTRFYARHECFKTKLSRGKYAAQHGKLGLFKNSARLKSHILHHTSTAHHCRSGVFQGSDSAGEILKTLHQRRRNFNYFPNSNICSRTLDVRKTNIDVSQFC